MQFGAHDGAQTSVLLRLGGWIATGVVVVLTAVLLVDWYVAAAEERGVYHQPWHKPASPLWHIALLTEQRWFSPLLFFSAGAGATLWAVTPLLRRASRAPHADDELRLTDIATGRLAIIDVFADVLETAMRRAVRRGLALARILPELTEVGTAEQELLAYARSVAHDFEELQRLVRRHRQRHGEVTSIVATTMEFNYFEVVASAREMAGVLARETRSGPADTAQTHALHDRRLAAFSSTLQRLDAWIDARSVMLAEMRVPSGRSEPEIDLPREPGGPTRPAGLPSETAAA